jgi:transcriptional activator of cad operon
VDSRTATPLRIGDFGVDPASNRIFRDGQAVRVEARTMRLLLYLAERAGEVVSIDDLLSHVWAGVIVTPDSVYQAVTSLRRLLSDNAREPAYIETVPRLGYRMIASVSVWEGPHSESPPEAGAAPVAPIEPRRKTRALLWGGGVAAVVCAAVAAFFLLRADNTSEKSVAVLPFLDLTSQKMDQEYFADGMTEELIDQLDRIPGLQVPPPTASFNLKGRKLSVAQIAQALHVTYLLDGSVRKSGNSLRISVRLTRADNGFVIWSDSFDREADQLVKVQEDIAGEVARKLRDLH